MLNDKELNENIKSQISSLSTPVSGHYFFAGILWGTGNIQEN
jgi:hypothetical protein